jgi:F-type H+/Na+-transporting ATPase subunit alpha
MRETLKQSQYHPLSVPEQMASLVAVTSGVFDRLAPEQIVVAEGLVQRAMTDELPELCNQIASGEKLSEDDVERVRNTTAEAVAELLEVEQKRES